MYLLAYIEDDFSLPDIRLGTVLTLGSPCFIIYFVGFGGDRGCFFFTYSGFILLWLLDR